MARASTAARGGSTQNGGAVLGPGARVRGRVSGDGDLRVEGSIEGDVVVTGDLAIGSAGAVRGDIDANAVTIGGSLTGDVAARGAVVIRAGAKVVGNMGGAEVSLEEGAKFSGRIEAEFELPTELVRSRGASPPKAPRS